MGIETSSASQLTVRTPEPRSSYLVFTSAGDHANVHQWLRRQAALPDRSFDLWVVYYGQRADDWRTGGDFHLRRSGSKFQNLHYCYQRWPEVFARYEAIMVMDDDIRIDGFALESLFAIRRELDLWALQPAFRLPGKISWDITRVRPTAKLRYTNFIEMACPLLRRDKLDAFMAVYDPELVGYGIDWWLLKSLGELEGHVAIIDEIPCMNPHDRSKGGKREIDQLQSKAQRQQVWERMKARYGLDEQQRQQLEYRRVPRSWTTATGAVIGYGIDWLYVQARAQAARALRAVRLKARSA
jgi:hypothetical protein